MTTTTNPAHLPTQLFALAKPLGAPARGRLALGGGGLLAVGLKCAAVSVAKGPQRGRDGWGSGFVGGIGAVAVMAVARAVVLLRRPVRAIVDDDGVSVEGCV